MYPNDIKLELYHVMTKRYHFAGINDLLYLSVYFKFWHGLSF